MEYESFINISSVNKATMNNMPSEFKKYCSMREAASLFGLYHAGQDFHTVAHYTDHSMWWDGHIAQTSTAHAVYFTIPIMQIR